MHGVLVLDKPAGSTSARALDPVRAAAGRSVRVGHAGTLDPFATGVLLVLVGDATRLSELAGRLVKRYAARVRFGVETDTLDPEGRTVAEADPGAAPPPGLEAAVASLRGEIDQEPPAYSALHVDGRRAYAMAREGRAPPLAPRRVVVHGLEIASVAWPEVSLDVACGAGTYIRAIARDLGRALGLPASLVALRRIAIGPFSGGVAPADADLSSLAPPRALAEAAGLPLVELDPATARAFAEGRAVPADGAGEVAVLCGGALVGLGRLGDGRLRAHLVLAHARAELERGTPMV